MAGGYHQHHYDASDADHQRIGEAGEEVDDVEDESQGNDCLLYTSMHLGNLLISVSRPTHKKLFLAKICSTSSFLFISF